MENSTCYTYYERSLRKDAHACSSVACRSGEIEEPKRERLED